jgi:hypothetical protein
MVKKVKKQFLFVFDHSTNKCTKIDISRSSRTITSEEILTENGFNLEVCDWFYSEKDMDEIVYLPVSI